ncbi:hypothetical protein QF001_003764 [Paraburkholderia youngii]|uniref:head-tail connector protein n=1 Tax=Paraburkholderia youngii TaxID=2782701 RepID=UPI003D20C457
MNDEVIRDPVMLVSLDEAKQWLRIDGDELDDQLTQAIQAASDYALAYLKWKRRYLKRRVVPEHIRSAVAIHAGSMIRDPDGVGASSEEYGYALKTAINLMYVNRTPTVT